MQYLALFVFPDFKDDRIQPVTHSTDGQKLFRDAGSLIEPVRPREQLTSLFKPYTSPGIRSEAPTLSKIEAKAHLIYLLYHSARESGNVQTGVGHRSGEGSDS